MTGLEDTDMYTTLDSPRKNGLGLKNTSLSVLTQKKHHKTQTQKKFELFNQQKRYTQQHLKSLSMKANPPDQGFFQPPNTSQGTRQSSIRSSSSGSLQQYTAPPPSQLQYASQIHQQVLYQQQSQQLQQQAQPRLSPQQEVYYFENQPTPPQIQQGHWSEDYRENSEQSIGVYSPTFSEFTFEDARNQSSPVTSDGEWKDVHDEELNTMRRELERLRLVEQENVALKGEIQKLHNIVPVTPIDEASEELYAEIEAKEAELKKTTRMCEELEVKVTDQSQILNKLKLIHKTSMDQKNKEIARLKNDVSTLEKEMDSFYSEKSTDTANTSLMSSPSTECSIPVVSDTTTGKKNAQVQLTQSFNEEIVQDLLTTIRSLRSHNETLRMEKEQQASVAEREKRVLKIMAHASRNKVKIRKGITIVSEIDVMI